MSRLLFHKIHDDKIFLSCRRCPFLVFLCSKYIRIAITFSCGLIWSKLESALKKKWISQTKHTRSAATNMSRARVTKASTLKPSIPFLLRSFSHLSYARLFSLPLNIVKEVRSVSGRQYPRHFVSIQKTYLRIRSREGNHFVNVKVKYMRILSLKLPFIILKPWKLKWNARIGGGGIYYFYLLRFSHITSTHEFLSD